MRYIYLYMFGGDLKAYRQYAVQPDPITIGPVDLDPATMIIMAISVLVIVGVALCSCCGRGPARRSGPCPTTPTWRRRRHQHRPDDPHRLDPRRRAGGPRRDLLRLEFGRSGGTWASRLLLLMFAAITLGGLGNPFGALARRPRDRPLRRAVDWIVPERKRAEDRRRLVRADRRVAHPAAGHPRAARSGSDELGPDLLERVVHGDQRQRRRATASSPSGSTFTSATPGC